MQSGKTTSTLLLPRIHLSIKGSLALPPFSLAVYLINQTLRGTGGKHMRTAPYYPLKSLHSV